MFTEENLATAQIAQLFGSELLKVQSNSQTDSGVVPDIVKLDPKQFLYDRSQMPNQRRQQEHQLMISLQREAEAAYPIHEAEMPPVNLPPQSHRIETPIQSHVSPHHIERSNQSLASNSDVWDSIANSLRRIADSLEMVDISTKRKRIKRTTK